MGTVRHAVQGLGRAICLRQQQRAARFGRADWLRTVALRHVFFASALWRGLCALFAIGLLFGTTFPAPGAEKQKAPKIDDGIFTNDTVLQIQIDIPEEGLSVLSRYEWSREAKPEDRVPVRATVREGKTIYTNVAVHLKGAAGSFRPVDDKPGLTLNFDKFARGQRFHGLEKISLNNSVQDPSFITDKLCREVFDKAGVPVPREGYATVKLNGRALGLYVLVEGWNKQFLKRYFKNTKGNLYDCVFAKDVTGPLVVNSGEHPEDQSDLKRLVLAAREPDLTNRLARLEQALDLDRFITLLALDVILWNWDGYALGHNNYRLFHDLETDRIIFFPHGMDQMFWKPEGPIMPGMKGMVANAVIQIPECQRRYLNRVSELMTNVCRLEALTNRVQQLGNKLRNIQSEPANWTTAFRKMFQSDPVGDLLDRIEQRMKSLKEQSAGLHSVLALNSGEAARLTGWNVRTNYGHPVLKRSEGKPSSLVISVPKGSGGGSWSTTVWLEGGQYRITGKVRVDGVTANSRNNRVGAGFRVFSRRKPSTGVVWDFFPYRESNDRERRGELVPAPSQPPNKRLSGSTDWVELNYDFELKQPLADLEISCELRAEQGEARFDLDSLRIQRQ